MFVLFDLYIDAYEYVKAKKRCAFRIRLTGDATGTWHDIAEIENAHLLKRDVRYLLLARIVSLSVYF